MANPSPTISLWLDGWQFIQLSRKGFVGTHPVLKVHMHDTSRAAMLVIPSYKSSTRSFSLRLALQCGMFDLFDAESHTKISVPKEDIEPGELVVKAGAPIRLFDLKLDPRDTFWTQLLTPGRKYEIYWAHGDKAPWAYPGEVHQDAPERLPIRLGKQPITYTVLDHAATPLLFSVSVIPTDKTPLKELHGLEEIVMVEDETGDRVEWGWGIGCWEGTEPFPSDDMFEEFKPGVPYERTFWLTNLDENNNGGELTDLQAGKKYRGEVSKTLLRSFASNQMGKKEELLAGSEQERKERWARTSGLVFLDVSDPFTFETV